METRRFGDGTHDIASLRSAAANSSVHKGEAAISDSGVSLQSSRGFATAGWQRYTERSRTRAQEAQQGRKSEVKTQG